MREVSQRCEAPVRLPNDRFPVLKIVPLCSVPRRLPPIPHPNQLRAPSGTDWQLCDVVLLRPNTVPLGYFRRWLTAAAATVDLLRLLSALQRRSRRAVDRQRPALRVATLPWRATGGY